MTREIKYYEALREAQAQCLESDRDVLVMGLGVPGAVVMLDLWVYVP